MFNHSLKRWHSSVGLSIHSICIMELGNNVSNVVHGRPGSVVQRALGVPGQGP